MVSPQRNSSPSPHPPSSPSTPVTVRRASLSKNCAVMCRSSDIAELKATSSKSLIDKLKMFEINRRKLAKSRQNYGMQEVTSPTKRQICHVWELLKIREIKVT
ncbi:hypothetical protein PIB30_091431 [Stylosanthes scabra]|uniref:Uncharacterized protein n=1 Tax=Stylosanthes scabra TaxID=79078 RepID=A0ABU6YST9_9FABA|nr:hypothetical protein [Stylosanthes scabra]